MKILMCASEVAPFAKTGGLADVVGALPPELAQRGHDVRIAMPFHASIDRTKYEFTKAVELLGVPVGYGEKWCSVYETTLPGTQIPVYLFEFHQYFDRKDFYQHDGVDYDDNAERFAFFSRACLQLCKALQFAPDVIHCNDWQTGLIPVYLKTFEADSPLLSRTASVLSLHNVGYQGVFPKEQIAHCQLGWEAFNPNTLEFYGKINYLKAGILWADKVSTVSPTYAQEIQTPEHGWGLEGALRTRSPDLVGILNGCDYREWDPSRDSFLPQTFDVNDLTGKAECKAELQRRFLLPVKPNVPVIGMVTRLAYQKGVDVLAAAVPQFLQSEVQFVVLGTGEVWSHFYYGDLPVHYPGKAGAYIGFDEYRAHLVIAGSDFFLMPSRYEPCGLSQLASLRYGTLPIVRSTGGLNDTVENYDEATGFGDGFKFDHLTPEAIRDTVGWAVSTYYDRPWHIKSMISRAMQKRFRWADSAQRYEDLYHWALERKRG